METVSLIFMFISGFVIGVFTFFIMTEMFARITKQIKKKLSSTTP